MFYAPVVGLRSAIRLPSARRTGRTTSKTKSRRIDCSHRPPPYERYTVRRSLHCYVFVLAYFSARRVCEYTKRSRKAMAAARHTVRENYVRSASNTRVLYGIKCGCRRYDRATVRSGPSTLRPVKRRPRYNVTYLCVMTRRVCACRVRRKDT